MHIYIYIYAYIYAYIYIYTYAYIHVFYIYLFVLIKSVCVCIYIYIYAHIWVSYRFSSGFCSLGFELVWASRLWGTYAVSIGVVDGQFLDLGIARGKLPAISKRTRSQCSLGFDRVKFSFS